jgi:hypothetical protein
MCAVHVYYCNTQSVGCQHQTRRKFRVSPNGSSGTAR